MTQDKEIAILLLTHNNFVETKYCIETIKKNTQLPFRFHIFDYCSTDTELIDYLKDVCTKSSGYFRAIAEEKKIADVYNSMLETIYQEYAVILPINFVVNEGWDITLMHYYDSVHNSGCAAIADDYSVLHPTSALFENIDRHEDEMRVIYTNNSGVLSDMIFFKTDRIKRIKFDTHLNCRGYEIFEFSFKILLNGYCNYFVPKQIVTKIKIDSDVLLPTIDAETKKRMKEHIDILVKKHKLKFHPLTQQ